MITLLRALIAYLHHALPKHKRHTLSIPPHDEPAAPGNAPVVIGEHGGTGLLDYSCTITLFSPDTNLPMPHRHTITVMPHNFIERGGRLYEDAQNGELDE